MTANVLFAAGSNRAFEQFMQGKPGFDHYDSSEAVTPEDCGTCRKNRFSHLKIQHIRNIIKIPQEGRQIIMIKRETYMSRIRPFIGNDLVKVLTGIRRSGKSVMLDMIKEELCGSGVDSSQFISINFENMSNAHLCTAMALHDEIIHRASEIKGKVYLFF